LEYPFLLLTFSSPLNKREEGRAATNLNKIINIVCVLPAQNSFIQQQSALGPLVFPFSEIAPIRAVFDNSEQTGAAPKITHTHTPPPYPLYSHLFIALDKCALLSPEPQTAGLNEFLQTRDRDKITLIT